MIRLGSTRFRVLWLVMEGRRRGLPYTLREMGQRLGLHWNCVRKHLQALEQIGLVRIEGSRAVVTDYVFVAGADL